MSADTSYTILGNAEYAAAVKHHHATHPNVPLKRIDMSYEARKFFGLESKWWNAPLDQGKAKKVDAHVITRQKEQAKGNGRLS